EGAAKGDGEAGGGALDSVQQAFLDAGAVQCGVCTPGLIVAADDLLRRVPAPTDLQIREALAGNPCRRTGYGTILDAVRLATARRPGGAPEGGAGGPYPAPPAPPRSPAGPGR